MATLQANSARQLIKRSKSFCKVLSSRYLRIQGKFIIISILILLLLTSCNDGNSKNQPGETPTPADVVITIGNISDLTGVSANAMGPINKSLADMVEYYNEENLIPGVKLEIVTYDNQWDPSKDVPGYQRLRGKGADVIWTPVVPAVASLKSTVDKDKVPLFAASATLDVLMPPGYAFSLGTIPQYDAYTLMKWIAENDWDYINNGPAKIGGAAWADGYSEVIFRAMKDYAEAHPDQFEFVGGYLTDFTFIWGTQIENLKDCNYVWTPVPMHKFIDDYSAAGHSTKFIGSDPHVAFLGMIDQANLWEELNGALFIRGSRWWTEEGTIIDLTKELLYKNHLAEAEGIMRSGVGYLATSQSYQLCNIIKNAAETVGPENLDSQAIYEAAITYIETIDGIDRYSFDESKRCSTNYYAVYEADAERQNLYRTDPEWLPLVTEP